MKLSIYCSIRSLCGLVCRVIHGVERQVQAVSDWAWKKATQENLRTCNERTNDRLS